MSERNDLSPAQPTPSPPPAPAANVLASRPPSLAAEEEARARIAVLEREAKARAGDPGSALLFHEIGLLWEDPLKNPRNAAVAYQNAYKLAPNFVSNIRAARRLFAEVGNWQMVLQLLEAELSANSDPRIHARLLLEKARVLEDRLSREEEAARALEACLALEPTELSVLSELEQTFAERADHESLARVYRLLARALKDEALKAHYLTSAGLLYEDRLKKPEEAARCWREAFGIDRRDPRLLAAMKRLAERDGAFDELLAALAAEAELNGAYAAPVYLEIAKVYDRLARPEDALAALLAARRVSANEPLVLAELAQIYERQARYAELADVLLAWVGSINDESEVVAINLRLAALYEEQLKRDEDAVARYRAILARVPGHGAALAALGKLYHRSQNWEGLLSAYEAEIAALEDPRQKAARLYKAAEVLEERLGRQEEAIARYNQALQMVPGYLPAQKALIRLYERQTRYTDLIALYEQDLLQTADAEHAIATLNKMAALYEERLSDLDRAIDCLRRIFELVPEHLPTIRNLARLYERAERWRDLLQIQETEATLAGDTKQVLSLYHRNAEILEEQLQDRAGAIAAYERVLALSPSYLPALKALGRLYAQDGRWEDLCRMYRAEAEIAPTTEQAASLIYKVGEIAEQRLGNEDEAIASYQEVLTLSPTHFPAVRALARIYRSQKAWESLIEVLRAEAANRTDPLERANALYQAAAIWEDQLDRPEMAIEGYQEVLRLTPGHATALAALERLLVRQNNLKELVAVLDRQAQVGPPGAKVAAFVKLAHLYLDRLSEPGRAAHWAESALAIEPTHLTALKVLERVRASDRGRRGEIKARLAEAVADPRLRTALRLAAAADLDRSPAVELVEELQRAISADPHDDAAAALERALRAAGDHAGLAALWERRLEALPDRLEQIELLLRLADHYEAQLNDLARAAQAYERALALEPELLPALQGARRVWLKLGDHANACQALEAEGKASHDVAGAVEAFTAAGKIAAALLDDAERAIANYRQALERDPLNPIAGAALEELLAARGGALDLAGLHERRGEAKLAQRDAASAAEEFYAAARVYLDQLSDRTKALESVERALTAQPTHPAALELKGDLALAAHQYADAAAAYSVRVQQGGDGRALAALHLQLGSIYLDHLSEVTRAAAHLQTALAGDPTNLEALERLAAIHTASRNWTGAGDCLKRLLEVETRPEPLARHHVALAKIAEEGFGDVTQASALYRRALELAPGSPEPIEAWVALCERTGNLAELCQALEQQAGATKERDRAVSLWLRLGELCATRVNQPQKAVVAFQKALSLDPECAPAHAGLAELFARDAASTPMAIEAHRVLMRIDPTRVDTLHALFKLFEGQKQTDRAFCAASVLHFLKAANEVEALFFAEAKNRLPQDPAQRLAAPDVDVLLHPSARGPLIEVLRAIGDQLTKIVPPQLDQLGVDRKADRLKADHAVHKAIRAVAQVFAVEEFDVYQAKRGSVLLEATDPLAVCVGQDVVRKYNAREQKFLIGRAVFGLFNKAAVLRRLDAAELANLFGNAIRIHQGAWTGLGSRSEEATKQLRKACSRKALKALEGPAAAAAKAPPLDVEGFAAGMALSANRAGLLVCGDVAAGLSALLREDPSLSGVRPEGVEPVLLAVRQRADLRDLINYALSEDFFRLRQKLGMAV